MKTICKNNEAKVTRQALKFLVSSGKWFLVRETRALFYTRNSQFTIIAKYSFATPQRDMNKQTTKRIRTSFVTRVR